jgi:SNF2 family DNA or RNA helicase
MFQCIIADESHLLKNKSSVRTKNILPILQGCKRLILLSGTPALSRPIELYPQISAIGNMNLLWRNEDDYAQKYCKGLTNSTSTNDEASNFTLHNPESNDVEVIERNPSLVEYVVTISLYYYLCRF